MPTAADRAERGRGLRDDEVLAAALQVDAVLLPAAARVGRRLELADQPQLLERGLELGAQHAPLDAVEREQGSLDRRTLALAAEVGAQPGAQVARTTDVEHLVVAVAEEVDAGPRRGAAGEPRACRRPDACAARRAHAARRAAGLRAPGPARSGARAPGPSPRRRAALGGTVWSERRRSGRARRGRRGARGPRAAGAPARPCRAAAPTSGGRASAAAAAPGSAGRSGRCARRARSSPAKARKRRTTRGSGRGAPELLLAQTGQAGDRIGERDVPGSRATGRSRPSSSARTRTAPTSQMRLRSAESPVVSRSKTTNSASSSVGSERAAGEGDGRAQADDAAVAGGDLLEQRAGEPVGDRGRGEEQRGRPRPSRAARAPRACPPAGRARRARAARRRMKANICSIGKI